MRTYFKILLSLLLISASFAGRGQIYVDRSSPAVTAQDARLSAKYNLKIPVVTDTSHAFNGGLDSLGLIIYSKSDKKMYIRDSVTGGHKWTAAGSGGSADSTIFATLYRLDTTRARLDKRITDSSAALRSLISSGFDSASSQGASPSNAFHTEKYNDARYKRLIDSLIGTGSYATIGRLYKVVDSLTALMDTTINRSTGATGLPIFSQYNVGRVYGLNFPKIRDTSAAATQYAGDSALTIATHDTTSGNALQSKYRSDTARSNIYAQLSTKKNNSDSTAATGYVPRNQVNVLLDGKMTNYGNAPGQVQFPYASIPAATGYPTGTTLIVPDSGFHYVDTGSGGSRGWKKISGGAASGGSQTLPQVLATGRTLSTADSILLAAGTNLYIKGAQARMDSLSAGGALRYDVPDTFYFFGDSRTIIINPAVLPIRWSTILCQTFRTYEVNNAIGGSVINTWNGNSMQARLNTIPIKIPHRAKIFMWFQTNDISSGLSIDSFSHGNRRVLDTMIARGFLGTDIHILSGWTPSQLLATQTTYRDTLKVIAAAYGANFIDFSGISTFGERTIYSRMVGNGFYYDGTTHESREGNNYIASYVIPRVNYKARYDNQNTFTNAGMMSTDKLRFTIGDTNAVIPIASIAAIGDDGKFIRTPYQQIVHDNQMDSLPQSATINIGGDVRANQGLFTGQPTTSANVQALRLGFNGTTNGAIVFAGNGAGSFYPLKLGSTGKVLIGSAGDAVNSIDAFQVNGGSQGQYWRANTTIGSWSGKGSDMAFDAVNNIVLLQSRGSTGGTWYTTSISKAGGGIMLGSGTDKGFGTMIYQSLWAHKDSIPHVTATGSMEAFVIDTTAGGLVQVKRITIPAGGGISSLNGLTGSTQTFATGTSGTDFGISSSGTAHTFNIPDANGTTARGVVSTGNQSFGGIKTFLSNIIANMYMSSSIPSGSSAGLGAGTSPTITLAGSDQDGLITLTTGTGPSSSSDIMVITTLINPPTTGPCVTLTPGNANAAALTGTSAIYVTSTGPYSFKLVAGSTALAASTQYKWYYHMGGN